MKKRKIAALVIAVVYIFLSITQNWLMLGNMLLFLAFSLFFIFFAERAGSFIGMVGLGGRISRITKESPAELVEYAGWVLLLLPVIIYILTAQMG